MTAGRTPWPFLAAILWALPLGAQEEAAFDFLFRGPCFIEGQAGDTVEFEVTALLVTRGLDGDALGAEAWTMSLRASGCTIVAATPLTGFAHHPQNSFFDAAIAEGGAGVTLVAFLDFLAPTLTLRPADSPHPVLALRLRATIPPEGAAECVVRFEDGVEGPGRPVVNLVVRESQGTVPETLDELRVQLVSELCDSGLTLGGSIRRTVPSCLSQACFRLAGLAGQIGEDRAVILTLSDPNPDHSNALYVRCGAKATAARHEFKADGEHDATGSGASQRLVLPGRCVDSLFVAVVWSDADTGLRELTLSAEAANVALQRMSPRQGAIGHTTGANILGAGFEGTTRFFLRNPLTGEEVASGSTLQLSGSRVEATFALADDPALAALYDLLARDANAAPGTPPLAVLPGVFEVFPQPVEAFRVEISGLDRIRAGRLTRLTLRYENTGNHDIPAPLLEITGPPRTQLRLATDESFLRPIDRSGGESVLQVLAVNEEGIAGSLSPGAMGEIPIVIKSERARAFPGRIRVRHLRPNRNIEIPWASLQPCGVEADRWETLAGVLGASIAETWSDYGPRLAERSTGLVRRGRNGASVLDVFLEAYSRAAHPDRPTGTASGELLETASGGPLGDVFVVAIDGGSVTACARTNSLGRFTLEGLVAGVPYDVEALDPTAGQTYEVEVVGSPGGVLRLEGEELFALEALATPSATGVSDLTGCPAPPGALPCGPLPLAVDAEFLVPKSTFDALFISSWDPNEKGGSTPGGRRGRRIDPRRALSFRIDFENELRFDAETGELVTAPAHRVEIIDDLSGTNLDLDTVVLRQVRFSNVDIQLDKPGETPLARRASFPTPAGEHFPSSWDLGPDEPAISFQPVNPGFELETIPPELLPEDVDLRDTAYQTIKFSHRWDPSAELTEEGQGGRHGTKGAAGEDGDRVFDLYLQVAAWVDRQNEEIHWILQATRDPTTPMSEPDLRDPDDGFLLPNYCCGRGEGAVSFEAVAEKGLGDGRRVKNHKVRVTFDSSNTIYITDGPEYRTCEVGPPASPSNASPPDTELPTVHRGVKLTWTSDCRADHFNVFLWKQEDGESPPPGLGPHNAVPISDLREGTEDPVGYRPGGLAHDTTYLWQVESLTTLVEDPERGTTFEAARGEIWRFRTEEKPVNRPAAPRLVSPGNGACVEQLTLHWQPASRAESYAVFIGREEQGSPVDLLHGMVPGVAVQPDGQVPTISFELPGDLEPGKYLWQVVALNADVPEPERGTPSEVESFSVLGPSGVVFRRGDANSDGVVDLSDAVFELEHQFLGGPAPTCLDAADTNDDGLVDISDPVKILDVLFLGAGTVPPPGRTEPGLDPTELDCLGCESY